MKLLRMLSTTCPDGRLRPLVAVDAPPGSPDIWFRGMQSGESAFFTGHGSLEHMQNNMNPIGVAAGEDDWMEFINNGAYLPDVTGWRLRQGAIPTNPPMSDCIHYYEWIDAHKALCPDLAAILTGYTDPGKSLEGFNVGCGYSPNLVPAPHISVEIDRLTPMVVSVSKQADEITGTIAVRVPDILNVLTKANDAYERALQGARDVTSILLENRPEYLNALELSTGDVVTEGSYQVVTIALRAELTGLEG